MSSDAFINAVTHELKTPVASIRLYLETLQTRAVEESKRLEFYRTMLEDSDRLLATIEQILRTGRIGASNRKLNLSTIDVGAVVEDCLSRARALHGLTRESLAFEAGKTITIVGDLDEVRAAISNLVDNAVKYSGKSARHRRSGQRRRKTLPCASATVGHSSGAKQIFKRFYRVPGALASSVKGTGLGLFIVRSVAKRHRGRAWAESEGVGRGSTFILQLPISK